jgi:hypothetical protein|tara:strand:- start:254 stop:505 length:252 start_codon:yes stop_codon:yes gene_type:complete
MAGGGDAGGYKWNGKHISLKEKQRQNDNHITGETWVKMPDVDFAYKSSQGRYCTSQGVAFPYSGAYLCTEEEIMEQIKLAKDA